MLPPELALFPPELALFPPELPLLPPELALLPPELPLLPLELLLDVLLFEPPLEPIPPEPLLVSGSSPPELLPELEPPRLEELPPLLAELPPLDVLLAEPPLLAALPLDAPVLDIMPSPTDVSCCEVSSPSELTAAMDPTAMSDAMSAYSTAVTPAWSRHRFLTRLSIAIPRNSGFSRHSAVKKLISSTARQPKLGGEFNCRSVCVRQLVHSIH